VQNKTQTKKYRQDMKNLSKKFQKNLQVFT